MSKIQIITERIASVSYKFAKENDIFIFPANIIHDDEVIKDDNDKNADEFLRKLPTFKNIPSTSVPSLGEMVKILRQATKDTNEAIYVAASSKLSAMYSVGVKASEKLKEEGKDIRVFNSFGAVSIEGMYAYQAKRMADGGQDINSIFEKLEQIKQEKRITEYGVIETLKYLEKNGRIGKVKAWIGSLFSFKPIISTKDGVIEPIARARTNSQALEIIVDKIKEDIKRTKAKKVEVMYDHGLSDKYLKEEVNSRLKKEFGIKVISFNQISTVIACHLGPQVWGPCLYYE